MKVSTRLTMRASIQFVPVGWGAASTPGVPVGQQLQQPRRCCMAIRAVAGGLRQQMFFKSPHDVPMSIILKISHYSLSSADRCSRIVIIINEWMNAVGAAHHHHHPSQPVVDVCLSACLRGCEPACVRGRGGGS
eukprot:GHVU01142572.1.p1 GENE.GHVU01142572.1~~GHVU01142572.1.p1  ORF type:complete len:134 (-),score=9.20 GHVU01142572.1:16-417(-)